MSCIGELTRQEKDAELLRAAVVIDDTPVRSLSQAPSAGAEADQALGGETAEEAESRLIDAFFDDEDEVCCTGELTREEKNAVLLRAAVDISEDSPAGASAAKASAMCPTTMAAEVEQKPKIEAPASAAVAALRESKARMAAAAAAAASSGGVRAARARMQGAPPGYKPPPQLSFDRLYNRHIRGVPEDETEAPSDARVHVDAVRESWYELIGGWPDTDAPAAATSADGAVDRDGFAAFLYAVEHGGRPDPASVPPVGYIALANRDSLWGAGGGHTLPSANDATSQPPTTAAVRLNAEQKRAVRLAEAGESLFLTGGAGTGKSLTLEKVIQALQDRHGEEGVFVTASTGIAATVIGGTTVHSFAGIGLGQGTANELIGRITSNRYNRQRWVSCKALVIDEVSMLDGGLFDKLDEIGRRLRGAPELPFGGIQLILSGDFFQLPPVGMEKDGLKFLFEAKAWRELARNVCLLREVFRQADQTFVSLLNEMREAKLSKFSVALLRNAVANPPQLPGEPIKLFPFNGAAEAINQDRLHALPGKMQLFHAFDSGNMKWLLKVRSPLWGQPPLWW